MKVQVLDEPLLNDEQTAAILKVAVKTMPAWRNRGLGPKYVKYGRVVGYRPSDIKQWVNNHVIDPSRKVAGAAA
jgi:predicted DNA-binding transcriptional regulator AlpA